MQDNSRHQNNAVFTRDRAAKFLQELGYPISANRLAKLAVEGDGPAYRRWGGRVLYRESDLISWAEERGGPVQLHTAAAA